MANANDPFHNQAMETEEILELLSYGELEPEGLLPYSSNYTLLTTVTYQGICILAVYKPRQGERPLWDFPHGTLYRREVAAFLVSEALHFSFVPPTVVREGPYGIGALQFFIHNDQESHLMTMQREGCFDDDILRLAAFDYLINNADRKSGHCLKGLDNRLWAIDHGISFHHEYKLRTVLWDFVGQPFPPEIASALRNFKVCLEQREGVTQQLEAMLSQTEMHALHKRAQRLVRLGTYPRPGAGPNIPWPPV
jgi:hypothetical protein